MSQTNQGKYFCKFCPHGMCGVREDSPQDKLKEERIETGKTEGKPELTTPGDHTARNTAKYRRPGGKNITQNPEEQNTVLKKSTWA